MDLGLNGKTVIVTGGASNIGRGIVFAFAREHCRTAIADIDQAGGTRVAQEASGLGGEVVAMHCDITKPEQVEELVQRTIRLFGSIDILVNNVGWAMPRRFLEQPREEWESEVQVNLWGVINCTRAVLPHMAERRAGTIVSISSDGGRVGENQMAVYSACKAAVIGFTKSIAREFGRYDITANCVCPGAVVPASPEEMSEYSMWKEGLSLFTPEREEKLRALYPLRRLGTAQDMANAVIFLASDGAKYITGQTLSVSGGFSMV
jgi:2-hydroxycyclohexanecarboxyl-CoA dehydrogenase